MQSENWDDFRFILAVVEHGSLNAAARSLNVNHATVLRRVNGFQDRFGIQIFDRESSGYRIRADQTTVIEALQSLRDAFETAQRAMKGQGAGVRGPVKITSTDSFCDSILPQAIADLRLHHPDLSVDLIATNTHLDLGKKDAEVTVRPAMSLPDDLSGTRVCNLVFAIYGHIDYLAQVPNQDDRQWLMCSGRLTRSPCGAWQQANVPQNKTSLSADSFITLRQMCVAGLGLAILPCCIVNGSSPLQRVTGPFDTMKTGVWVANHRDLDNVPRIRACREFLSNRLKSYADILEGRLSCQ